MEHPCPPLIRGGLRSISDKSIANSYFRWRQRGLAGGTLWVPNKIATPMWQKDIGATHYLIPPRFLKGGKEE